MAAKRRLQERFFAYVRRGRTVAEALRLLGLGPSQAHNWLKDGRAGRDLWYEHQYRRLVGPTGKTRHRCDRFFALLATGRYSIAGAARAAGWDATTPYAWRRRRPDLWARVVESIEAAKAAEGRRAA